MPTPPLSLSPAAGSKRDSRGGAVSAIPAGAVSAPPAGAEGAGARVAKSGAGSPSGHRMLLSSPLLSSALPAPSDVPAILANMQTRIEDAFDALDPRSYNYPSTATLVLLPSTTT